PNEKLFAIGAGTPWNTEVSSTLHWVIVVDDDHHAPVAQGIEHRSPKAGVGGSNPPGGADRTHSSEHRAPRRPILSDRPASAFVTVSRPRPAGGGEWTSAVQSPGSAGSSCCLRLPWSRVTRTTIVGHCE